MLITEEQFTEAFFSEKQRDLIKVIFDTIESIFNADYGGLNVSNGTVDQFYPTAGVYQKVDGFTHNFNQNVNVTPDHTQDILTIDVDGLFNCTAFGAIDGDDNVLWSFELRKNDVEVVGIGGADLETGTVPLVVQAREVNFLQGDTLSLWATADKNNKNLRLLTASLFCTTQS